MAMATETMSAKDLKPEVVTAHNEQAHPNPPTMDGLEYDTHAHKWDLRTILGLLVRPQS